MNPDILKTLLEIRGLLFILVVMIGATLAFRTLRNVSQAIQQRRKLRGTQWGKDATRLYHDKKLDELKQHCESRLLEKPRDALATWWLARTYQAKNEPELARQYFRQVIEIAPGWKASYVDPFFDDSHR